MTSPDTLHLGRMAPTLPVRDIPAACTLYAAVFGFETVFQNGDPVGFVILKRDAAELHLILKPDHKGAPVNVAHLMVPDADLAYRLCQQHGLRIIKRIQDKEYGLRAFVFADPDGNRIDVAQAQVK